MTPRLQSCQGHMLVAKLSWGCYSVWSWNTELSSYKLCQTCVIMVAEGLQLIRRYVCQDTMWASQCHDLFFFFFFLPLLLVVFFCFVLVVLFLFVCGFVCLWFSLADWLLFACLFFVILVSLWIHSMQDREIVKKRPGYHKLLLVWLKYFSFSEAGSKSSGY